MIKVKNYVDKFVNTCDPHPRMNELICGDDGPKQCIKPDLRDGLVNRQKRLQEQLDDVNKAIDWLDKNPGIKEGLELLGKAGRY